MNSTPERYCNALTGESLGRQNRRSSTATTRGSALNWFATLSHPDNITRRLNDKGLSHAIFKPRQQPQQHLHLLVLDTSASSLGQQALNQALSACGFLCKQAYLARQHCALISFGNNRAQVLIPPQRAVKNLAAQLGQIDAGGGTPLRLGLEKARQLLQQYRHRYSLQTVYLLSDGRSKDMLNDLDLPCPLVVIDTEQARVPLARARQLAERLNAEYLDLASLPFRP